MTIVSFVGKKFPEECDKGYATEDKYYWVCPSCFEDFKDMFNWKIESE
jgi:lipopolysaccharide biosynthesis regulator YciM